MSAPPVDPAQVGHYVAALKVAKLSPATVSATFGSAAEMREVISEVAKRSIPDAAAYLRRRFVAVATK